MIGRTGRLRVIVLAFVVVFAAGRAAAAGVPAARDDLLAPELQAGRSAGFVDMGAFAPAAGATAPLHALTGRLALGARVAGDFHLRKNEPYDIVVNDALRSLPPFDFAFIQDEDQVIPLRRGPIETGHPNWDIVLEPGLAWTEPGDGGFTRAAIPFALQERNANCLHNGVMSFLFRDDGAISSVFYEIASETCAYFKFEAWGIASATFTPGVPADAAGVVAAYRHEVSARLPVRPVADLAEKHPGLNVAALGLPAPKDGDLATLFGVVVDGINYIGGCETRHGPYPFCDVLTLPSYSMAKSLVGGVGLMRLEKLSPGARFAHIADYVPECATRPWRGVTFENALDMTTGIYRDPGFSVDELAEDVVPFYLYESHDERIRFSCTHYRRKAEPGTRWVYRTTDTYALGTAMAAYARRHLGQADFYTELLFEPVWKRLNLSPLLASTLRSRDEVRQPFSGYGLFFHRDDIARLARFLSVDEGAIDGVPVLDQGMLRRALQRDPTQHGWEAGFPNYRYLGSLWARNFAPVLGCTEEAWVPYMAGFGGNTVAMLPDGIVYYYFGDSGNWDLSIAAVELHKLRPLCR